jgi:tRNA A22 N-methylase
LRGLSQRIQFLADLCPKEGVIVDVGADHGHVAYLTGGIATERQPRRRGRSDVTWVVADGLRPFRNVDCAVIAGMGAKTIEAILAAAPAPGCLVLHTPDDSARVRRYLATHGWRIDAERLAREPRHIAQLLRAVPGTETSAGHELDFGPRLLEGDDPLLREHLTTELARWHHMARVTSGHAHTKHAEAMANIAFLHGVLEERGWDV